MLVSPAKDLSSSILFRFQQSLETLVTKEGPDVTLWRALMGQILTGFRSSEAAYSLQNAQGQIFDFIFIPASEFSQYGAIQVTERISSARSRVVWRMPFITAAILNEGLTSEANAAIYTIDEQDEVLMRTLFRQEQTAQRESTHQVLSFSNGLAANT